MIDDYSERPTESTQQELQVVRQPVVREPPVIDTRPTYQESRSFFRSYHVIWFIFGLIIAVLALRFVFELLGANPYNAFVQLVYALSFPFAAPFQTIFGVTSYSRSTFDWSLLVAMGVYLLIAYGLTQLLKIIQPVPRERVHQRIRTV